MKMGPHITQEELIDKAKQLGKELMVLELCCVTSTYGVLTQFIN
jgi:hypothetical protein